MPRAPVASPRAGPLSQPGAEEQTAADSNPYKVELTGTGPSLLRISRATVPQYEHAGIRRIRPDADWR